MARIGRIGDWNNLNNDSDNGSRPSASVHSSHIGAATDSLTDSSAPRFATLSSLGPSNVGGGAGRPPPPRGNDDDDDDDKEGENWFAGGERSGISIQNPNARGGPMPGGRMVQDILRRAAETSAQRASQSQASQETSTAFRGGGHMLGSDDVESTFVPDQSGQGTSDEDEEVVQRNITFWRNGFSIEGGEFYSHSDPENEQLLAQINTGRAPLSVLNTQLNQTVDVVVSKRLDEDYIPEQKPFGGAGQRLGSPVPVMTSMPMPGSFPTSSSAPPVERARINTMFEVDQTKATTTVQIRLADGTRLLCRMNLTHTVGDIRRFIGASQPENVSRPYTIGTTFPNRILEDDKQSISDAGLVNSVVVQRWV